jgi:hypothetical protein
MKLESERLLERTEEEANLIVLMKWIEEINENDASFLRKILRTIPPQESQKLIMMEQEYGPGLYLSDAIKILENKSHSFFRKAANILSLFTNNSKNMNPEIYFCKKLKEDGNRPIFCKELKYLGAVNINDKARQKLNREQYYALCYMHFKHATINSVYDQTGLQPRLRPRL